MTYRYKDREFDSLFELAKVFYTDSDYFAAAFRHGDLLSFVESKDRAKADKIRRLLPLSYPDDVFVFLSSYVLNPAMGFRIKGERFDSYEALGRKMLLSSPSVDPILLEVVSYQLLSKQMHACRFDRERPAVFQKVLAIERQGLIDREKAYFSLAYYLSGKRTILYKGVEYKDVFNLTYYLARTEKDLSSLGSYLSSSSMLEAYKDYAKEGAAIDIYLHVVKSLEKDENALQAFLKRRQGA